MELREFFRSHYQLFCEVTDPVSLASRLRNLTDYDREEIQRKAKYDGRQHAIQYLYNCICGKVSWEELFAALMEQNVTGLAEALEAEFYKKNPSAPRRHLDNSAEETTERKIVKNFDEGRVSRAIARAACNDHLRVNTKKVTSLNIHAQTVILQIGDCNNVQTSPDPDDVRSTRDESVSNEDSEKYEVCAESEVPNVLPLDGNQESNDERVDSKDCNENILYSRNVSLLRESTAPKNVRTQLSCSADSQDGDGAKQFTPSKIVASVSEGLRIHHRLGNEMTRLPENSSSVPSSTPCGRNAQSLNVGHGKDETVDMNFKERLGISLGIAIREQEEEEKEEEHETYPKSCD